MSELTKPELIDKINELAPSSIPNAITAAIIRELMIDMVDSYLSAEDVSTPTLNSVLAQNSETEGQFINISGGDALRLDANWYGYGVTPILWMDLDSETVAASIYYDDLGEGKLTMDCTNGIDFIINAGGARMSWQNDGLYLDGSIIVPSGLDGYYYTLPSDEGTFLLAEQASMLYADWDFEETVSDLLVNGILTIDDHIEFTGGGTGYMGISYPLGFIGQTPDNEVAIIHDSHVRISSDLLELESSVNRIRFRKDLTNYTNLYFGLGAQDIDFPSDSGRIQLEPKKSNITLTQDDILAGGVFTVLDVPNGYLLNLISGIAISKWGTVGYSYGGQLSIQYGDLQVKIANEFIDWGEDCYADFTSIGNDVGAVGYAQIGSIYSGTSNNVKFVIKLPFPPTGGDGEIVINLEYYLIEL